MAKPTFLGLLLALWLSAGPLPSARGDDADTAKLLRERGAKVVEAGGAATSVDANDCSKWGEEEFRRLGQLAHLKNLTLGPGLDDRFLALLGGLAELETLQTNLSTVTDEGVKLFLPLRKLKVLKFFHPAKSFTGTGLAALAELPNLERLTVAGSLAFGDEGMAAVATLVNLREFRSWHAGQTLEGVKKLRALKNLKSLTLGQRLAYTPPTTLADESIAVLAEIPSLETLQLEEARLTFESLRQLARLPALKKLTLEGIDLREGDLERIRGELPKAEVQWTRPSDVYMKRIKALFGS
ncbi:MAG TPA: hypothetical protein VEN81_14470 [Planctomycetota bacterium]|nr:hypothetical protein [Planctomycetota bacterium]